MKTISVLFFMLPSLVMAQQVASEDELIGFNKNIYVEYVLNNNPKPFAEAATDDFVLITGIGTIENKQQVINGVKNLKITSLKVMVDKTIITDCVGIVVGKLVMEGTVMGQPIPKNIRFSSVFVKEGGKLRLKSRTMTPVRGRP